jgi:hypothetical protein
MQRKILLTLTAASLVSFCWRRQHQRCPVHRCAGAAVLRPILALQRPHGSGALVSLPLDK